MRNTSTLEPVGYSTMKHYRQGPFPDMFDRGAVHLSSTIYHLKNDPEVRCAVCICFCLSVFFVAGGPTTSRHKLTCSHRHLNVRLFVSNLFMNKSTAFFHKMEPTQHDKTGHQTQKKKTHDMYVLTFSRGLFFFGWRKNTTGSERVCFRRNQSTSTIGVVQTCSLFFFVCPRLFTVVQVKTQALACAATVSPTRNSPFVS